MTKPDEPPQIEGAEPPPQKRRRPWRRWLFLALAVPVLLLAALLFTDPGNGVLWRIVSQRIEAQSGWRIEATGFRLGWGLTISADRLVVTTPAGRQLARARSVDASIDPSTLRGLPSRVGVRRLVLRGVWFDPGALPPPTDEVPEPATWRVDIAELILEDGRVETTELEQAVVLPLGDRPVEIDGWSAVDLEGEGRLTIGERFDLTAAVRGLARWRADGLRTGSADVAARLALDDERLELNGLSVRGEGLEVGVDVDCRLVAGGACRVAGTAELLPALLLEAETPRASRISWNGELDLGSRLGDFRLDLDEVPLAWGLAGAEGLDPGSGEWLSGLLLSGQVDYRGRRRSAADGEGASVDGTVALTGRDPSGRTVLELSAALDGGGLDAGGRLDPWTVGIDGELVSSGASVGAFLSLLPRSAGTLLDEAGLARAPLELTSTFALQPDRGGEASLRLILAETCPRAGVCPSVDVEAADVRFALDRGRPDWSSLSASVHVEVLAFPGDPVWRQVVPEDVLPALDRFAGADDLLTATVDAVVAAGRVEQRALSADLRWTAGANADRATAGEELLTLVATSLAPEDGGAARIPFRSDLLPGLEGRRSVRGTLRLPDGLSMEGALLETRVEFDTPFAQILHRLAPFAGAEEERVVAVADVLAALPTARLGLEADLEGDPTSPSYRFLADLETAGDDGGGSVLEIGGGGGGGELLALRGSLRVPELSVAPLDRLLRAGLGLDETPSWLPSAGSLDVSLDLDPAERTLLGTGTLEGSNLVFADVAMDRLEVTATRGADDLWRLEGLLLEMAGATVTAQGDLTWSDLGALPAQADLALTLSAPARGLRRMVADVALRGDLLEVASTELVGTGGGTGALRLGVPLGALRAIPALDPTLADLGVAAEPDRAVAVRFDLPRLRLATLDVEALEAGPVPQDRRENEIALIGFEVEGELRLDEPAQSRLDLRIDSLEGRWSDYAVVGGDAISMRIADGRIEVPAVELQPSSKLFNARSTARFRLSASARLRGGGFDAADPVSLVEEVRVDAEGPADLALLQGFLAPARADGRVDVTAHLEGPLDALSGSLAARGPEATIQLIDPYVTLFSDLALDATLADGVVEVESFSAELNQGRFRARGTVSDRWFDLAAVLDEVRYRIDYGLSTQLSGNLDLRMPVGEEEPGAASRRGTLTGDINIDRGLARREIDLDDELRTLLFAPGARAGDVDPLAARLDLNLTLTTEEGIRVRNNVADLRATWDELRVRGTLAEPLIEGLVEADAGGLVTAYGQVVRIDAGQVRFRGQPGVEPEIELDTTSSLEDPSIRWSGGGNVNPFSSADFGFERPGGQSASEAFTGGLADYLGSEIGSSVGQTLGSALGGTFNVRPVFIFGETEPSARLIVTREINENLDIGVSLELRNAEERLYLLDVHDLPIAPSLSAQIFTNERGNEGATVQQHLELGGSRRSPLQVGRIRFTFENVSPAAEERLSENKLRRDLGLDNGDEWFEGSAFDAEVDVLDSLRSSGFASPEIEVDVSARGRRRDLRITVDPGIPAAIEFEGLEPAKTYRRAIRLTYRNDFFQEASLREMVEQTRTALEAEGWLGIDVDLAFTPAAERSEGGDLVVLTSAAERRVTLDRLSILGLDPEGALAVEGALESRGSRVALLLGDEGTRRRVENALAGLGWLQADLIRVEEADEGRTLELDFETGRRARIADIRLVGIDEDSPNGRELQQLVGGALTIAPGDPVVERELAGAAILAEDLLRDEGYADASVVTRTVSLRGEEGSVRDPLVEIQVEAGELVRIATIEVPGNLTSKPEWIRRFVSLDPGEIYDRSEVRASRRRMLGTGVFSSIRFETLSGVGDSEDDIGLALRLRERPRWSLAYGLRWETEEGLGAVLDVVDRNAWGRGLQIGARALVTSRREAARVYGGVQHVLGSPFSMESFLEVRESEIAGLRTSAEEATFQLGYPLSPSLSARGYFRYSIVEELDLTIRDAEPLTTEGPVVGTQLVWDGRAGGSGVSLTGGTDLTGALGPAAALFRGLEGSLGTFASLDLSTSAGFLGSDFDYVRAFGQVFHSQPAFQLGQRKFVWAQSWRLGYIENRGDPVPRAQRFFAGGEYSVRGYDRESLGPRQTIGEEERALGGEAVFVVNQELRFPVAGDFEGVVFLDGGNVWEVSDDLFDEIFTSSGIGLRYRSPIGLLRLDVAFPLDRRDGEKPVRYYLGFGHVF